MNKKLCLVTAPQFAIIAFIVFNILAILTYPGGTLHNQSTSGYSFFHNFLSDLGRFISWNGSHNFYANLLNIFCFLVLVNGTNLIDGVNCSTIGYFLIISIILLTIQKEFNIELNNNLLQTLLIKLTHKEMFLKLVLEQAH